MFFKIGVLKNYSILAKKTPVFASLFNKAAGLKACIFIKKEIPRRYFSVNITKFLRTAFLWNTFSSSFSEI